MKNHQRDSKLCKSAQAGGVKERYYVKLFRASSGFTDASLLGGLVLGILLPCWVHETS